nr:FIST N-terminal domain-containing protein [Kineococcus vitellinus]
MARWDLDLGAVAAGAHAAAGGAAVVGTSTGTVFARGGQQAADVVVTAVGGPGVSVGTGASTAADPHARGVEAVTACGNAGRAHSTVLLLPTGTDGQQQAVVRGAYSVLGPAVPLVGGGSDGDMARRVTWQLHGREVVENGLVAVRLDTDRPVGVGTGHGLARTGEPMVVTDSDGLLVRGLDGRPALDAYLERLGVRAEDGVDAAALAPLGFAHPLALVRRRREEVRTVVGMDVAARSLEFVSEVPPGSLVSVMSGGQEDMLAGAVGACADAVAGLGGAEVAGMVVFSCIARRELLSHEGRLGEARAALSAAAGPEVVLNYSCGEIARVSGAAGCHNQTVVALAL